MKAKASLRQSRTSIKQSKTSSKRSRNSLGSKKISKRSQLSLKQVKAHSKRSKVSSKRLKTSSKPVKVSSKRSQVLSRQTFIIAVITGFLLFLAVILCSIIQKPIQSKSALPEGDFVVASKQEQTSQPDNQAGKPIRLSIPKIEVDAGIESVGLEKGAVGAPKVPSSAAWYNLGAKPGDVGNAVITGHYGPWIDGRISVFDNLYKLNKGDKIYIKDDKGKIITFVVRELKSYDRDAKVTEIFISTDGKSHLNLITCDGVWNTLTRQYSKRLVVFADKIDE